MSLPNFVMNMTGKSGMNSGALPDSSDLAPAPLGVEKCKAEWLRFSQFIKAFDYTKLRKYLTPHDNVHRKSACSIAPGTKTFVGRIEGYGVRRSLVIIEI